MSRQLHAVEIPEKQLMSMHNARLVASAVILTLFVALVAFAPHTDPGADTAPAMTAAAMVQMDE